MTARAAMTGGLLSVALIVFIGGMSASGAAHAREVRDYVRVVTALRNYDYLAAVVDRFGENTRFKYPEIVVTNAAAGGKLLCEGNGLAYPDLSVAVTRVSAAETALCLGNAVEGIVNIRIGFDTLLAVTLPPTQDGDAYRGAAKPLALTSEIVFQALAARVPADAAGEDGAAFIANPYRRWNEIDPELPDAPIALLLPPRGSNEMDLLLHTVFVAGCRAVDAIAAMEEADPDAFAALCGDIRSDDVVHILDNKPPDVGQRLLLLEQGFGAALNADPALYQVFAVDEPPRALAFARPRHLDAGAGLEAVAIDGRGPERAVITSGAYPLARPVYLRIKTGHFPLVPGIRDFISQFISAGAIGDDGYLVEMGLTPVSEEERETMKTLLTASARPVAAGAGIQDRRSPAARLRDIEMRMWDTVGDGQEPEPLQSYLDYFPDGMFASRARRMLAALRQYEGRDDVADEHDGCAGPKTAGVSDNGECATRGDKGKAIDSAY